MKRINFSQIFAIAQVVASIMVLGSFATILGYHAWHHNLNVFVTVMFLAVMVTSYHLLYKPSMKELKQSFKPTTNKSK